MFLVLILTLPVAYSQGPLVNPAKPTHMIAGVANIPLGNLYAQVLLKRGCKRSMVINSVDGLDEITPSVNLKISQPLLIF